MNTQAPAISRGSATPGVLGFALGERACRFIVLAASIAFCIGWTLVLGKGLHWDAVNYHFYLGFAALNDRFGLDYFAAGTPSYINPYAYVPLYLLTRADVPAVVIATIFGAVHALILWLTYEITLLLIPTTARAERRSFALLAVVLAALNPMLLQSVGMTLVDVPLGGLVVASWLLMGISLKRGTVAWVAAGALLAGLATGLKLSNAIYAPAALAMLAFFPGGWRRRLQAAVVFGAACGLGFVAISAPWSARLWETFGNPLFPFLNDVFKSSDFTSAVIRYERFRPASLWEYLRRPFDLMSAFGRQHTEARAPDMRYAVLFVAMAVSSIPALRYFRSRRDSSGAQVSSEDESLRILLAFAIAFVIAWGLWLATSANSRYFISMGCVAGALLAAILQRSYRRWRDSTIVLTALILLAQAVQVSVGSDIKRDGATWEGPLMRATFSERYRNEPHLFLSTSFSSGSGFLQHWHPQSGMITISGFYSLGPGRPGWERVQAMLARNEGRVRSLTPLPKGFDETTGLPGPPTDLDFLVRRFGLSIDPSDCELVKLETNYVLSARSSERERWSTYITCALRTDPAAGERYLQEVAQVDPIFDRVEEACRNLFHPAQPVTEQLPKWTRLYNMGSEIQLWIDDGRLLYRSPFLGGDPIDIGTVEAWSTAPQPIDCSRKSAPAFGGFGR